MKTKSAILAALAALTITTSAQVPLGTWQQMQTGSVSVLLLSAKDQSAGFVNGTGQEMRFEGGRLRTANHGPCIVGGYPGAAQIATGQSFRWFVSRVNSEQRDGALVHTYAYLGEAPPQYFAPEKAPKPAPAFGSGGIVDRQRAEAAKKGKWRK